MVRPQDMKIKVSVDINTERIRRMSFTMVELAEAYEKLAATLRKTSYSLSEFAEEFKDAEGS